MPGTVVPPDEGAEFSRGLGRMEAEERKEGPPPLEQWKVVTGDVAISGTGWGAATVSFTPAKFVEAPLIPGFGRTAWVTQTVGGIVYYTGAVLIFNAVEGAVVTYTWVAMGYSR